MSVSGRTLASASTMQSPCRHWRNSRNTRSMSNCCFGFRTLGPLVEMMKGTASIRNLETPAWIGLPVAIILKPENLARFVFFIRGEKVMLDSDLARLYGVEARALNQAVARNRKRFPADFMFQLTPREYESLRSQTVISKEGGSTDDVS